MIFEDRQFVHLLSIGSSQCKLNSLWLLHVADVAKKKKKDKSTNSCSRCWYAGTNLGAGSWRHQSGHWQLQAPINALIKAPIKHSLFKGPIVHFSSHL